MRRLHSILFLCLNLFFIPLQSAEMHTLMLVDSDSDSDFYLDYLRVSSELETACLHTGLEMREKLFSGRQFRVGSLKRYLSILQVEPDDVIVFYYTGHGFRDRDQDGPWPKIDFLWERGSMDMQEIFTILEAKGARFVLAMSDTCNNFADANIFLGGFRHSKAYKGNVVSEAYKKLFLDVRGHIYVTSSDVGEYSYVTHRGSVFTNAFIASLKDEVYAEGPLWESLIQKTAERTEQETSKPSFDNVQHVVYEIALQ